MDHVEGVGGGEAVQHLDRHRDRFGRGQGSGGVEVGPEVGATDEVGDDRQGVGLDDEVPHRDDVRRRDAHEDPSFLHETGHDVLVGGQLGAEHLGGELLPGVPGGRAADLAHGSPADHLVQEVPVAEGNAAVDHRGRHYPGPLARRPPRTWIGAIIGAWALQRRPRAQPCPIWGHRGTPRRGPSRRPRSFHLHLNQTAFDSLRGPPGCKPAAHPCFASAGSNV